MLSQLFIESPRGDVIIFKDFKGNVPKASRSKNTIGRTLFLTSISQPL
jgi:hypothetical protein